MFDHHFNRSEDDPEFSFVNGDYAVEVFATVVGQHRSEKLAELTFTVDSVQAAEIIQIPSRELYLLWNPETCSYEGQVRDDASSPI